MSGRIPIIESPYNAETPMGLLDGGVVRAGDFFVRSHFAVPALDPRSWRLAVHDRSLDLSELRQLPVRRVTLTLECAGNGRTLLQPEVKGAPWKLGGVGTAEFEGVSLANVLAYAAIDGEAREILFRGADSGDVGGGRIVAFERSLPIDVARDPDVLVAWGMNGAPLAPEHGAPVRLVVPGWYGVASVKWLAAIRPLSERFDGYFQRESYVYRGCATVADGTPVGPIAVRSVIASPADGDTLPRGDVTITGSAWSGRGPIGRVEVSIDGGRRWADAFLGTPASMRAATPWTFSVAVSRPGPLEILSRATDVSGATQPDAPVWNALGYANNAVSRVTVRVG